MDSDCGLLDRISNTQLQREVQTVQYKGQCVTENLMRTWDYKRAVIITDDIQLVIV